MSERYFIFPNGEYPNKDANKDANKVYYTKFLKTLIDSKNAVNNSLVNNSWVNNSWVNNSWKTHTKHPGNSTPTDNGWTDVKKFLGLDGPSNPSDALLNHALVSQLYGDNSVLPMWNTNKENEKSRNAQNAYNAYWKSVEEAKANAESLRAKEEEYGKAKVRYAALLTIDKLNPAEKTELDNLVENYPKLKKECGTRKDVDQYQADLAEAATKAEAQVTKTEKLRGQILAKKFKNQTEKNDFDTKVLEVAKDKEDITAAQYNDLLRELNGVTSLAKQKADQRDNAIATKVAENTKNAIDIAEAQKIADELNNGTLAYMNLTQSQKDKVTKVGGMYQPK